MAAEQQLRRMQEEAERQQRQMMMMMRAASGAEGRPAAVPVLKRQDSAGERTLGRLDDGPHRRMSSLEKLMTSLPPGKYLEKY